MRGWLIDSNVILDIFLNDPHWADWSSETLHAYQTAGALYINPIIYTEISIGFKRIEELESAVKRAGFQMVEIPREALFLAGKAFLHYKRNKRVENIDPARLIHWRSCRSFRNGSNYA